MWSPEYLVTNKVERLRERANKVFPATMNALCKRLLAEKLDQIARAIEKQKPHDLPKLFDKAGINRWSVLNKPLLAAKETVTTEDDLEPGSSSGPA